MGKLRNDVSFRTAVRRLRPADFLSFEAMSSLALGIGLALTLFLRADVTARINLAGIYLAVLAALLAIVFAGLALVAALLSEAYLRLLRTSDSGLLSFFRPFVLAVGVQTGTLVSAVLYYGTGQYWSPAVEPWLFGIVSVFFFASCLEIVVLTRSVLMHALLRSRLSKVIESEAKRDREGYTSTQ